MLFLRKKGHRLVTNISYKLGLLLFMSQSQSEGDIQVYCASHQRCDHCNGHMASQLCDIIIESFHLLTSFVNTFCKTLEFEIMHYINIFFLVVQFDKKEDDNYDLSKAVKILSAEKSRESHSIENGSIAT